MTLTISHSNQILPNAGPLYIENYVLIIALTEVLKIYLAMLIKQIVLNRSCKMYHYIFRCIFWSVFICMCATERFNLRFCQVDLNGPIFGKPGPAF